MSQVSLTESEISEESRTDYPQSEHAIQQKRVRLTGMHISDDSDEDINEREEQNSSWNSSLNEMNTQDDESREIEVDSIDGQAEGSVELSAQRRRVELPYQPQNNQDTHLPLYENENSSQVPSNSIFADNRRVTYSYSGDDEASASGEMSRAERSRSVNNATFRSAPGPTVPIGNIIPPVDEFIEFTFDKQREVTIHIIRETNSVQSHARSPDAESRGAQMSEPDPELSIPKKSFRRMVREIIHEIPGGYRLSEEAVQLLQRAAEEFCVKLLGDHNLCATHDKRVTIMERDSNFVTKIRQEFEAMLHEIVTESDNSMIQ